MRRTPRRQEKPEPSVLSRGIDALWVSPDVTVVTAIDVLLAAAKRARVPVFTSLPGNAEKGALFDLGADYLGIGRAQGELAADVLDGRDPATVPVENLMPVQLHVNRLALNGLRTLMAYSRRRSAASRRAVRQRRQAREDQSPAVAPAAARRSPSRGR